MECRDIFAILSARADGEADPGDVRIAEEHLERCAECRRAAERILRLGGAAARTEGDVPLDFREKLFARLEKEDLLSRRRSLFAYSGRWALVPAALAAGVMLFLLTSRGTERGQPAQPAGGTSVAGKAVDAPAAPPAASSGTAGEASRSGAAQPSPSALPASPQPASRAVAVRDLSPEERDIVANLDVLESAQDLDEVNGADDFDLLLPAGRDRG